MALDPEATPDRLRAALLGVLGMHAHVNRRYRAAHASTTPRVLEELSHDHSPLVVRCVGENPMTPPATLERLGEEALQSMNVELLISVVRNHNTPAHIVQRTLDTPSDHPALHVACLSHPGVLPEQIQARFRTDLSAEELVLLVGHPNVPPSVIDKLSKEKRTSVLINLVGSGAALPESLVIRMASHTSPDVRGALVSAVSTSKLIPTPSVLSALFSLEHLERDYPTRCALKSGGETRFRSERKDLWHKIAKSNIAPDEALAHLMATAIDAATVDHQTWLRNIGRPLLMRESVAAPIQRELARGGLHDVSLFERSLRRYQEIPEWKMKDTIGLLSSHKGASFEVLLDTWDSLTTMLTRVTIPEENAPPAVGATRFQRTGVFNAYDIMIASATARLLLSDCPAVQLGPRLNAVIQHPYWGPALMTILNHNPIERPHSRFGDEFLSGFIGYSSSPEDKRAKSFNVDHTPLQTIDILDRAGLLPSAMRPVLLHPLKDIRLIATRILGRSTGANIPPTGATVSTVTRPR